MKSLICYLSLLFYCSNVIGLNSELPLIGVISGQVVDAKTNDPIPYVNIIVSNNDENIVSSGITSEDGKFNIDDLQKGNYKISIQFIGISGKNSKIAKE